MTTPLWHQVCDQLIDRITYSETSQSAVDDLYSFMCSSIFTEMDKYIPYKEQGRGMRKRFKNFKPYWNEDLTTLWRDMVSFEKQYKRCTKNSTIKSNLWAAFKHKQYAFDKALRQAERAYNRSLADDIESINSEDPKLFWEHIKKLGPAKKNTLPTSVKDGSNNLVDNIDDVLNVWRTDFENLYNLNDQGCTLFDDTFLSSTLAEKERLESLNCDSTEQIWYNNMFTVEEMDKVCNKLKEGKSTGPDMIPNTVLKHVGIKSLCLSFINVCFENHCVPSSWQQAIIAPIP